MSEKSFPNIRPGAKMTKALLKDLEKSRKAREKKKGKHDDKRR